MGKNRETTAPYVFILLSILWGLSFPLIDNALHAISPYNFVVYRFALAAGLYALWFRKQIFSSGRKMIFHGLILGLLNGVIYTLLTVGMKYIDAERAAFLMSTSVIMVPFLSYFILRTRLSLFTIAIALFCLLGIYILTGANLDDLGRGDFLLLACAASVAFTVIYIQKITVYNFSDVPLAFYQILFTSLLPLAFATHPIHTFFTMNLTVWVALLFCAVFATVFTVHLQIKYQRYTTPTKVAIIFSLEPVVAYLSNHWMFNEPFKTPMLIGGLIVVVSVLLSSSEDWLRGAKNKIEQSFPGDPQIE